MCSPKIKFELGLDGDKLGPRTAMARHYSGGTIPATLFTAATTESTAIFQQRTETQQQAKHSRDNEDCSYNKQKKKTNKTESTLIQNWEFSRRFFADSFSEYRSLTSYECTGENGARFGYRTTPNEPISSERACWNAGTREQNKKIPAAQDH